MDTVDSFKRFKTITFGRDFMMAMIKYGNVTVMGLTYVTPKDTLNVSVWLHFVPEEYKEMAIRCLDKIGVKYLGEMANADNLSAFISDLQQEIWRQGENI